MRKSLFAFKVITPAFLIISLLIASCKKDSSCDQGPPTTVASAAETASVQSYLNSQGITNATQLASGMFYSITTQGTGASPNVCNAVTVSYVGTLFNGSQFDATTAGQSVTFPLTKLIKGWQLALPLLKSGGEIILYIPPSLGYGAETKPNIPANSNLKFVIQLKSVS